MNDNHKIEDLKPLVFHIRSHRQWHGLKPMTQKELANKSGVPIKRLMSYEGRREIPSSIQTLFSIAKALNTTMEELIAPHIKN